MIPASSETLTIAVILLFLFGAISFYLYSRITQIEKKMSLLENILLDLKVATESSITSFPLPDQLTQPLQSMQHIPTFNYMFSNNISENIQEPIDIDNSEEVLEELEEAPESSRTNISQSEQLNEDTSTINNTNIESIPDQKELNIIQPNSSYVESIVSVNKSSESPYDNMTVKELQVIAKTKGISVSGLKRVQIIDVLKQHDSNKTDQSNVMPTINEVPTIEEIFSSGEGGELLSMDAPSSLVEASPIDN